MQYYCLSSAVNYQNYFAEKRNIFNVIYAFVDGLWAATV